MNRREFVALVTTSLLLRAGEAFAKSSRWQTDPKTGEQYTYDLMLVPTGTGFRPVKIRRVKITFEKQDVIVSRKPEAMPGPEVKTEPEAAKLKADVKANDPDVQVDTEGYSFGAAGLNAAGSAIAYGVASALAGLPDQAKRISALQQDVQALQQGLANQIAAHQDVLAEASAILASRGRQILTSSTEPQTLPSSAFDDILRRSDQVYLFATPDPFLATRLHGVTLAIAGADPAVTPGAVVEATQAMVRQSDAASAMGEDIEAEGLYSMARNVADLAVGLDPISGVVRSSYELVTGKNMITGATLSQSERAFAAVNLMLLGEFGLASRGLKVVARIGQTLGGARAVAIGKAAIEVAKHWPVKTIEKVMAGSAGRALVSAGEHIALSANKALVPVGAVDGVYARVMSASYAQKLATGGTLAAGDLAFITEAKAIEGLSKWDDVRRRLSLMDPLKIGEFRAFADDVIVEFKFASNEPLAFLAKPFGEVGRFGSAFLPGGYTAGGAPEWVVDALAAEKNMLDIGSIKIRPIKP
jgi:hypothetical protein